MGFYREQKIAFNELDGIIKRNCLDQKLTINITEILLELTKRFELSEKNLLKRIEQYPKVYPQLKIMNDKIINMESEK